MRKMGQNDPMFSRRSLLAFAVLPFLAATGMAGASKPTMTFRIHIQVKEDTKGEGAVLPIALANPQQIITVSRTPKISENHLQSVIATPDGGMMVQTTTTGARLLEEATISNPNQIMVVLLNGQVVYSPVIDIPLRSGRLLIPGPIPPELITALQARIVELRKR